MLLLAIPTYATDPMSLYTYTHETNLTQSPFPAGVQQGPLSQLERNRIFFHSRCETKSSFQAGAQQVFLSQLVRNRVFFSSFFPSWAQHDLLSKLVRNMGFSLTCCDTGSSFPVSAQQGLLSQLAHNRFFSLLVQNVAYKFISLKFCHGILTQRQLVLKHTIWILLVHIALSFLPRSVNMHIRIIHSKIDN